MTDQTDTSMGGWNTRKVFRVLLILLAVVGCAFLLHDRIAPHRSAVVIRVGRISTTTSTHGTGRHRHKYTGYKADVKVKAADTGETETVYYRVPDKAMIPAEGEEIQFSYDALIGGNVPFPTVWQTRLGLFMLGIDAVLWLLYWAFTRKKQQRE